MIENLVKQCVVRSRKGPYSHHRRDWKFLEGGEGFQSPKTLRKHMNLNWNFQKSGGLRRSPFRGGTDISWNHTIQKKF